MSASSAAGIPTPDGVHRRRNPLTGEWILVSAGRDKRPWQGQIEPPRRVELPSYDPDCYLCPGNERAGGQGIPTTTRRSCSPTTSLHSDLIHPPPRSWSTIRCSTLGRSAGRAV